MSTFLQKSLTVSPSFEKNMRSHEQTQFKVPASRSVLSEEAHVSSVYMVRLIMMVSVEHPSTH